MTIINGTPNNDDYVGDTSGDDTIYGLAGNDIIVSGRGGVDAIDGGVGTDVAALLLWPLPVSVTLTFMAGSSNLLTLPNGTNLRNIELLSLTTGTGDSSITYLGLTAAMVESANPNWNTGNNWYAQGANDTATFVLSNFTQDITFQQSSGGNAVLSYFTGVVNGFATSARIATLREVETYRITFGSGNDAVTGDAGNDIFDGGFGNDEIAGGLGNDQIDGGYGTNTAVFSGGLFDYTVQRNGPYITVSGPEGTDTLTNIQQLRFNGLLALLGTNQPTFYVSPSAHAVFGMEGNDSVNFQIFTGSFFFDGGDGNDAIDIPGAVTEYAISYDGLGNTILTSATATFILRNVEQVNLLGSNGLRIKIGASGTDVLFGGFSPWGFIGGPGNDDISNGASGNTYALFSGSINGYTFTDNLDGSYQVAGPDGIDRISGIETLLFPDGSVQIGNDNPNNLSGASPGRNILIGGGGNDTLFGNNGSDTLLGGSGDDTINPGPGNDAIDGGNGNDSVSLQANFTDAVFDFNNDGSFTVTTPLGGADTIKNVEYLEFLNGVSATVGTVGNDTIPTNGIVRIGLGGPGNDTFTFQSLAGTMTVDGGHGTDRAILTGSYIDYSIGNITTSNASSPSGSYTRTNAVATSFNITANLFDIETLQFEDAIANLSNGVLTYIQARPLLTGLFGATGIVGEPISVAPGIVVHDPDDTNLLGATARIVGGYKVGDILAAVTAGTSIAATFNTSTGVLTIVGSDTLANYQAVLRTVTFTGQAAGARTIQWQITDDDPNLNISPVGNTSLHGSINLQRDLDGNSKTDIVWRNDSGQPAIWFMNGTSLLPSSGLLGDNPGPTWQIMTTGDFGGDGKSDILWQHGNGQPAMWQMDGTAILGGSGLLSDNPGPSWLIKASGDFDGDGHTDILWQNISGQAAIWMMNGMSILAGSGLADSSPGPSWHIRGAGDFNGDGRSDILWQNNSGQAAIWLMNGLAVMGGSGLADSNPGSSWRIRGAGDFNGDDRSDILWQNDSGQAAIWLMNGLTVMGGSGLLSDNPGPSWTVKGSGDFSGDGKADILWQNTSGQAAIWLMNGTSMLVGSGLAGDNPGSAWRIIAGNG